MKPSWLCGTVAVIASASAAQGAISVHFDQSGYTVAAGGQLNVLVRIDGDSSTAGDDPVAAGLLAYGYKITFAASQAQVSGPADIAVPALLDFNGFDAGAVRSVSPGLAAVTGTVDFNPILPVPYAGTLLGTIAIHDIAPAGSVYTLELGLNQVGGPAEDVFLDGDGNPLDAGIAFGSARVVVVPEPAASVLALAAPILLRRRAPRQR